MSDTELTQKTFDATGRSLGRLASEVSTFLQGKSRVDYKRNQVANVKAVVENASQLDISAEKLNNKTYERFSGYPGGQKTETARSVVENDGYGELIRRAVYGMLPDNKLRKPTLKNLEIQE